ncbi:hypothetical protein D3C76_1409970 [compost metagenome]
MDRELAKTGTRRQALGKLELQVLEPGTADRPAKTHDGGLADPDAMRQVGHGAMHYGRRVKKYVVGDFKFRLS